MREHCIIDGKRCSKCCEVLTVRENKNLRDWIKYGRYDNKMDKDMLHPNLCKISKRRAKKINPYLVSIIGNDQSYYTCRKFTGSGCGDYENRPSTCSEYPYYGQNKELFHLENKDVKGLYEEDCTYFISL